LITGWKISYVDEDRKLFIIDPIVEKEEASEEPDGLTSSERLTLTRWGFYFSFVGDITIQFMRQVDMLEADFKDADISEIRKLAEKMKLSW
jgi:hypothetical protein